MITTMALANTSILSHNYHFFLAVKTFKNSPFSNFQVRKTRGLAIITMLYINFLGIINLKSECLYPWSSISPLPPTPSAWEPWLYPWFFQVSAFLDSSCKWYHTVFVFLWLTLLSFIQAVRNSRISFFSRLNNNSPQRVRVCVCVCIHKHYIFSFFN